jgi:predicted ATPase/DNA-binding SARP family transcriptional activator/class 3 adenylate cyclase
MEFRILGSFEVVGTAGVLDLRGAKRRGLLACLLVHAGQPLSTDRLVEELWSDGGSGGAARTVQTYVSQLRRLLRDEPASLTTRPGGYVLEVDPGDVDAHLFAQGLVAASAEGDLGRRLEILNETLELWRGRPLGEFTGAGWADREATRLEGLHLQALQRRYDSLLAIDRPADAVAELETLVQTHALDERLWAQLMLALYRSGRQADALGAYQQARRQLVDQLGIEPGPELAELEHRILDHDPTLVDSTDPWLPAGRHRVSERTGTGGWYPRTFLLTDIVDSVSLWERDQAGMSQAVARHDALIRETVHAADGELVRTKGEGDSTFSVFAHPAKAVAAAVAIQAAVTVEQWPAALGLRVRAGVHTGDAEPRDGDWYGPAVNRAARLRALAHGGETLLSGVTAGLVADQLLEGMRLLYRGRRVLRGIERPEEVWELVGGDDPRLAVPPLATTSGLPFVLTRFVGRSGELERLVELTEGERLVTLTGPGGGGKTRLAVELARDAQRRGQVVWLAEIAPVRDGELVAQTVATAVGLEDVPDPVEQLVAQPERLDGLLVLDNCEHLLDDCAALTGRLLAGAPGLRVLATSREPLGLTGERVWPVKPLEVPAESTLDLAELAQVESVELLLDRARAVQPDLEMSTDDTKSVVRVCRALDGIPLAIELAAGRLRSLSLGDLASRLSNQAAVLARPRPTGPHDARHQTLRLALDWSYDLLTDQQQTLAQRLSVFAGGFRLDAVDAVCGGDLDVLDGVDELVAKSLVNFDGVTARYRLLEPLRQYFAERLEACDAAESIQQAHAEWVAGLCHRLGTRLLEDQRARSFRLSEEASNIDAALRWAQAHDRLLAMRLVGSLGQYWFVCDQASGRRWCEAVIEASTRVTPRVRAKALLSAGMVAQNDQAWDRSVTRLREALALFGAEGVVAGEATSLYWLGRALVNWWEPEGREQRAEDAKRCFEEGARLFIGLGDWVGVGACRIWLSQQAYWYGELERSEQLARRVIDECREAGAHYPVAQALSILAFSAYRRGHNDAAVQFLQDAIALCRELDDRSQLAGLLVDLAALDAAMGQGSDALQALAESSQLDIQTGRLPGRSRRLAVAAVTYLARGEPAMSALALGAYDTHPETDAMRARFHGNTGWLAEAVQAARARLDPTEITAAAATTRRKSLDELIDELIIQPAMKSG